MQTKEEKFTIFKLAVSKAFNKLKQGTSPTTVAMEYDIAPSVFTSISKGEKDPLFSSIFRISEAYKIDPRTFLKMVMDELPENFTFSET